jgi:hypothetical protein
MDLQKLTIEDIKKRLKKEFGIEVKGKPRKQVYIDTLMEAIQKSSGVAVKDALDAGIEIGKAQAVASINRSLYPMSVVSVLNNLRRLVIVKFENPSGITTGCYDECKNFAFEWSSGTSNVFNFKRVYLPILRLDANMWLNKPGNFQDSWIIGERLKNMYKSQKVKLSAECETDLKNVINEFLPRFGCWSQIQISAALARSDDLWQKTRFFRDIREIALNYNYCPYKPRSEVYKEVEAIKQKAKALNISGEFPFTEGFAKYSVLQTNANVVARKIKIMESLDGEVSSNIEKAFRNPDKFEDRFGHGFYYRRDVPIQPLEYDFPEFVEKRSANNQEVNKWLSDHDALCKKYDNSSRKFDLAAAEKETKKEVIAATGSEEEAGKYFGWRICND